MPITQVNKKRWVGKCFKYFYAIYNIHFLPLALFTDYPYLENNLLLDPKKFSIIREKKTLKKFFTRYFFVTSNRCKLQIKDKISLLILNIQIIVFDVVKICVFKIFLNFLSRAYHVSSFSSNLPSFLCPIFLGIFILFISWQNCSPCLSLTSPRFSGNQSR